MALIGEIQKRMWIVFVLIGISLIGFLLMDSSGPGGNAGFGRGNQGPEEFASINGLEIEQIQYLRAVEDSKNRFLIDQGQFMNYYNGDFPLSDQQEFNFEQSAWSQVLNERLIADHAAQAGIGISDEELAQMVYGLNPHPRIQQLAPNLQAVGLQPGPGAIQQYADLIQNQQLWQQNPGVQQLYIDFVLREREIMRNSLQQKYGSAISRSSYVPGWLAKRDYAYQNTTVDFDLVQLTYRDVADEEVEITPAEVEAHYRTMKDGLTPATAQRNVEYVVFKALPTSSDSNQIYTTVEGLRNDWINSNDSDSVFLRRYSRDPIGYAAVWLKQSDLYSLMPDSASAEGLYAQATDSISAIYQHDANGQSFYKSAKVWDRGSYYDSIQVRHIYFRPAPTTEAVDTLAVANKADSVYQLLLGGEDYISLAARFSEDESTSGKGGELGWVGPNINFVRVLKQFVLEGATVGQPRLIRSPQGWHIMEVTDRRDYQEYVKAGWLGREIVPLGNTKDSVYNACLNFFEDYGQDTMFDKGVSENSFQKRISGNYNRDRYAITGLPDSREVITWSFRDETEVGDVQIFRFPSENTSIVARLRESSEKGTPSLEKVRTQVETDLINKKKAEILKERIASAGTTDLNALASALGTELKSGANAVFANASLANVGSEPAVVGALFSLNEGEVSEPIVGKTGVFVIRANKINKATEPSDVASIAKRMQDQQRNQLNISTMINSMKRDLDVVDNRDAYN